MGDVYEYAENAENTVVWLGEDEGYGSMALPVVQKAVEYALEEAGFNAPGIDQISF
jgi:hypothetical protein